VFLFWVKDLQCMIKDYKGLIQAGESYFKGSSPNVGIILFFEQDIGYKTFIESVVAQTPYYKKYYLSNRIVPWITGGALNWDSIGKLSELSESLGRKPSLPVEKQSLNNLVNSNATIILSVVVLILVYVLIFSGSSPTELAKKVTLLSTQITTLETEKGQLVAKFAEETKSKNSQVNALTTKLKEAQESKDELHTQVNTLTTKLKEAQESKDELHTQVNTLTAKLNEAQEKITKLKKHVDVCMDNGGTFEVKPVF